jgi:hypothetical protein
VTNSRSFQRVATLFNILFGLIAAGIVIGVFKNLLIIVALWLAGASRLLSVAIAASIYIAMFVLSLVMRRRGFESWKAIAWALSPVIGLFVIVLSATYLFGICDWDSLRCAMPMSPQVLPSGGNAHYTSPQPTSAEIDANTRAQAVADDNQRRTLAVNKCATEKVNIWKTQNPDASQQQGLTKLMEISKECREQFPSPVIAQPGAPVQDRRYRSDAGPSIIDTPAAGDNRVNQAAVNTTPTHPRVYRCSGPGGTTVFTDMPCAPDSAAVDDHQAHR